MLPLARSSPPTIILRSFLIPATPPRFIIIDCLGELLGHPLQKFSSGSPLDRNRSLPRFPLERSTVARFDWGENEQSHTTCVPSHSTPCPQHRRQWSPGTLSPWTKTRFHRRETIPRWRIRSPILPQVWYRCGPIRRVRNRRRGVDHSRSRIEIGWSQPADHSTRSYSYPGYASISIRGFLFLVQTREKTQ